MCGIAGIFNRKGNGINEQRLTNMRDTMLHRGPDAGSQWTDTHTGLAHRRLSIIDLSEAANQPFHSDCGRYVIVFNGEIFNYQDFYAELKAKGFQFKTSSDTEVLIALIKTYGWDVLHQLIGFFSFAWYDKEAKELTIVRDRFGVKPLFYANTNEEFLFASEPKALHAAGLAKNVNVENLDEQFYYRHVSGENTVFENVKRLLPGHMMVLHANQTEPQITRWFNLSEAIQKQSNISNPLQWFEETFHSSIKYRMIADVKIGTMLSGGLDSSAVLFSQTEQGFKDLSAWNIKFSNYEHDESVIAAKFAAERGATYNGFEFVGENLVQLVQQSMRNADEPLMHLQDGHLLGLAKEAKKKVTVLMTGEGADEILGGYVRYKMHDDPLRYKLLQLIRYVPNSFLKQERWKKMKRYMFMKNPEAQLMMNANNLYLKDLMDQDIAGLNILPAYRTQVLEEAKQLYPKNTLRQLLYVEQHIHLCTLNDRNDRTSMGASIESREPFLDHRLLIGAGSLNDDQFTTKGKGKALLMNSIGKKLPDYIQTHRKIGLSVPWERYMLEEPFFKDQLMTLHECPLFQLGNLSQIKVQQLVKDFVATQANKVLVKELFFLGVWYNTVVKA